LPGTNGIIEPDAEFVLIALDPAFLDTPECATV